MIKKTVENFVSERKQNKENFQFSMAFTAGALLLAIIPLFIYYVWAINSTATMWFDIRELEQEKRKLLLEKDLLEVKIAELESSSTLESETDVDMIDAHNPQFLVIRDNVQYVYNN